MDPRRRSVLTIGNFDGVHRAHQQLLARVKTLSNQSGAPAVVLTFDPHPLAIVAPAKTPQPLAPLQERLRFLDRAGMDIVVVAKSEPALLNLEADRFIEQIIVPRFHPKHIVEGPSFGFGRGRRGDAQLLQEMADRFDFDVHIVEPVTICADDNSTVMVSSSLVRRLLADGDVGQARKCLGRPYALLGSVVRGDGRGRTIGFPTANLATDEQLIPGDGVYAGRATLNDQAYAAAISIGSNPTFSGDRRLVEAYLLDYDGDLYGRTLRLEFDRRLRDQQTFDSSEALVSQLHRDVELVRNLARTESHSHHC